MTELNHRIVYVYHRIVSVYQRIVYVYHRIVSVYHRIVFVYHQRIVSVYAVSLPLCLYNTKANFSQNTFRKLRNVQGATSTTI